MPFKHFCSICLGNTWDPNSPCYEPTAPPPDIDDVDIPEPDNYDPDEL